MPGTLRLVRYSDALTLATVIQALQITYPAFGLECPSHLKSARER